MLSIPLAPKIFLIYHSLQLGLPVVSSMGSGKTGSFENCSGGHFRKVNCNLARMLRKRLHKLGFAKGEGGFSSNLPIREAIVLAESRNKVQCRDHLLCALSSRVLYR